MDARVGLLGFSAAAQIMQEVAVWLHEVAALALPHGTPGGVGSGEEKREHNGVRVWGNYALFCVGRLLCVVGWW